jgi:hypothetical protein
MDVVEETVDVVEETLDTLERIPKVRLNGTTRKQGIVILAFTALAAAAASGVVVGTIVKKRTALRYEEIIANEVAETRAFYQSMSKPPIEELAAQIVVNDMAFPAPPEETLDPVRMEEIREAGQALTTYQGRVPYDRPEVIPVEQVPEVQISNVFVEGQAMDRDEFDYETEIANRTEDNPYIISYEEFNAGEKEYTHDSLTWYDGDDTLADSKDQPILTVDDVVGEDNMHKFGHGSRDPHIVYIRNDRLQTDFEVVKNNNSFQSAVLGFQHSDKGGSRKTPRFRGDDG